MRFDGQMFAPEARTMKLTGGQIVVETLRREGIPYLVGVPGHATLGLCDALLGQSQLQLLQVRHEQAAVHLADGYYRASGAPLAVLASMGTGAMNTLTGLASCSADSVPVLVLLGSGQVEATGRGGQDLELRQAGGTLAAFAPMVKGVWRATSPAHLPRVLQRALAEMLTGRRGPVVVELPLDVQCDAAEVDLAFPQTYRAEGPVLPDPPLVQRAAGLLAAARRPVILAGGGVVAAEAWDELQRLAELLEAPVLTTMMGKGAFPEDHILAGLHAGAHGTTCGNALARSADVLLAVGTRFAPPSTSFYRQGETYSIPPTRLVHLDLDPAEIGKNYPVEVGIVADARKGLAALLEQLQVLGVSPRIGGERAGYLAEVKRLRHEWLAQVEARARDGQKTVNVSRLVAELRAYLRRDAIVLTSSGTTQAGWFREAAAYEPRTSLSTGGLVTVGWTLPAALGARLASSEQQVVGLLGDGDFLVNIQELATAAQYDIPVVLVVANNAGWIALRDLQAAVYGPERTVGAEFRKGHEPVTPDLASLARGFGCYSEWITSPEEVGPAVERALAARRPAVVEVMIEREDPPAGQDAHWCDVPVPAYLAGRRAHREERRAGER
jgi:acetolactate synthase I/II/III large subunit